MNPRRLYGPVVLATLAAGGAVILAAGRPWARTTVGGTGVPDDQILAGTAVEARFTVFAQDGLPLEGALVQFGVKN